MCKDNREWVCKFVNSEERIEYGEGDKKTDAKNLVRAAFKSYR